LELPNADQFKEPNLIPSNAEEDSESTDDDADQPSPDASPKIKSSGDDIAVLDRQTQYLVAEQRDEQEALSAPADEAPIRSASDFDRAFRQPPADDSRSPRADNQALSGVRIELDASGNLILSSPDTDALDRLENLMLQIKPPKRPYQVFHIEHASASWMRVNLEDYYKDLEESDGSNSDDFYRYYFGRYDEDQDDEPSGLGKGNKLRIVDDLDTNTLVITGATGEQLRTITELIELWDVPEPVNKRKTRFTTLVEIKYGKADKIAETVKEAYRDLLSSNDKAFTKGGQGQNGKPGAAAEATKSRNGSGSGFQNPDSGRDGGSTDFSFKGKLSLGIDTIGNTLLVSAEGEPLLELVTGMIEQLDEAARPQGEVRVLQLSGGISGQSLQNALRAISGEAVTTSRNNGNVAKPSEAPK
jgi:hypothetical protein